MTSLSLHITAQLSECIGNISRLMLHYSLAPNFILIIWLSNLLTLNLLDEGWSINMTCALHLNTRFKYQHRQTQIIFMVRNQIRTKTYILILDVFIFLIISFICTSIRMSFDFLIYIYYQWDRYIVWLSLASRRLYNILYFL